MKTFLTAATLITADGLMPRPLIEMEDGLIVKVGTRDSATAAGTLHDFPDAVLTTGLLDIHTHGAAGHDVMEATPEALAAVAQNLARHGVSAFLPTTVTAPLDETLGSLENLARLLRNPVAAGAQALGIHLEGPFISHAKRGMHPPEHLLAPNPDLLDRLQAAADGQIRLITIAPEVPGALDTIRRAIALGIKVSLGHSNATAAETEAAIAAGAVSATHTFNAMRPLDHREPGILGIVLDRDDLFADLICDGIHVAPAIVRLWLKAKGPHRAILISDSIAATDMPDGIYKLGSTPVNLRDGICTTAAGVLAGSVLTLDRAILNLIHYTGTELAIALRAASTNPRHLLGLPDPLAPGSPANFTVLTSAGSRLATFLQGVQL